MQKMPGKMHPLLCACFSPCGPSRFVPRCLAAFIPDAAARTIRMQTRAGGHDEPLRPPRGRGCFAHPLRRNLFRNRGLVCSPDAFPVKATEDVTVFFLLPCTAPHRDRAVRSPAGPFPGGEPGCPPGTLKRLTAFRRRSSWKACEGDGRIRHVRLPFLPFQAFPADRTADLPDVRSLAAQFTRPVSGGSAPRSALSMTPGLGPIICPTVPSVQPYPGPRSPGRPFPAASPSRNAPIVSYRSPCRFRQTAQQAPFRQSADPSPIRSVSPVGTFAGQSLQVDKWMRNPGNPHGKLPDNDCSTIPFVIQSGESETGNAAACRRIRESRVRCASCTDGQPLRNAGRGGPQVPGPFLFGLWVPTLWGAVRRGHPSDLQRIRSARSPSFRFHARQDRCADARPEGSRPHPGRCRSPENRFPKGKSASGKP